MDKQHVKGAAQQAKGSVKKAAGKATGNKRMENEGRGEKLGGKLRRIAGDIKDAVRGK